MLSITDQNLLLKHTLKQCVNKAHFKIFYVIKTINKAYINIFYVIMNIDKAHVKIVYY